MVGVLVSSIRIQTLLHNQIWISAGFGCICSQYTVIVFSLVRSRGGMHSNRHVLQLGLCLVRGGLGHPWRWRWHAMTTSPHLHVLRPESFQRSVFDPWQVTTYNYLSIHIQYFLLSVIDDFCQLLVCRGRSCYRPFVPQNRFCLQIAQGGSDGKLLKLLGGSVVFFKYDCF